MEIKSRKGMALLAYTATADQPVGRDLLATLLWPEFNQTRARANLRRTLYALNQTVLAQWLQSGGESVSLDPAQDDLVDVRLFDELIRKATPEAWIEALALYKADFLEGFFLPDSEPFDEWRTVQQQSYQRKALETLDQLIEHHLEDEAYSNAEGYARRQLEIDNLREPAWRYLMTILARSGRRSEALVEFERCRQLLWDELGVEPAAETMALVADIRALSPDTASKQIQPKVSPVKPRSSPRQPPPELLPIPSPYRGLFAFREEDAPFFFGREEFTDLLAASVSDQSILAVIGSSGSGKSSVVYAGLLARLKQTTDWVIASFRPGQRPLQALAASLVPFLDGSLGETARLEETNRLAAAFKAGSVTLYDVVERIRQKRESERLVLVADQFEELYTLVHDATSRHRFLDVLLELVFMQQYRPAPVFTLVLTLRADFLGQALSYRPTADAIQEVDVKLGPMTGAELKRAVAQPAQKLGVAFEAGLVPRILDDVGHEPGNLPLLEFALTNLWEKQSAGHLTHNAYEAIGRVEGALARYADNVFSALSASEQLQARRIFVQLVRPGEGTEDTRRLATRAELDGAWSLVHRLADARLVITGRDPAGNDTVEIVHEALIQKWGRLRDWMAADRDFRVWQERLRAAVRDWQSHDQDESGLLRGVSLSTAENWLAERPDDLSQVEKDFIIAGIELRRRREMETARQQAERERLRRRFTWALAAGMLLALILASAAFLQWRSASRDRDAARVALARQLVAQSQALLDENLDLSLLLAVEAVSLGGEEELEQNLVEVLAYSPNLAQFLHLPESDYSSYLRAGLREDGLLAMGDDASITFWDVHTGQRTDHPEIASRVNTQSRIVFSPDGSKLATISVPDDAEDSRDTPLMGSLRSTEIYRIEDGQLLQTFPSDVFASTVVFSPDGSLLTTVGLSRTEIWDVESGQLVQTLEGGELAFISFSPDSQLVAGSGAGGRLFVWDLSSGEVITNLPAPQNEIYATAFSPDGRFLVTASAGGSIRFWETEDWSSISQAIPAHDGPFLLAFSPDGATVVSAGEDGVVRRWLVASGEELGQPMRGHQAGTIVGVTYAPGGETLLTGMTVGTANERKPQVIAWKFPYRSLFGHDDQILGVALGPEESMITSVAMDGKALRWSGNGQFPYMVAAMDWSLDGNWWGAALAPDGQRIARGSRQGPVVMYDGNTGEKILTLDEPPLPIAGIDFTTDSRWIAGAGCGVGSLTPQRCDTGRTWVWDAESGDVIGMTNFTDANMVHNDVAISDDGRLVASGTFVIDGDASRIVLWDVATGELLAEQEAQAVGSSGVFGLAFSPDGTLLTGNGPREFTIWEIGDGGQLSERFTLQNVHNVTAAAFSSDGRRLATGQIDGTVALWDVETGSSLAVDENAQSGGITALRFNDDGSLLVSGSQTGRLVLHNIDQMLSSTENGGLTTVEAACVRANRNLNQAEWQRYFGDEPYRETCPDLALEK